jgi:hypothetical protein
MIVPFQQRAIMAPQLIHQQIRTPEHDLFYVIRQTAPACGMVTVAHEVPSDSQELGSFENPNQALDFAEYMASELQAHGVAIEFVDPPYGLVGAG